MDTGVNLTTENANGSQRFLYASLAPSYLQEANEEESSDTQAANASTSERQEVALVGNVRSRSIVGQHSESDQAGTISFSIQQFFQRTIEFWQPTACYYCIKESRIAIHEVALFFFAAIFFIAGFVPSVIASDPSDAKLLSALLLSTSTLCFVLSVFSCCCRRTVCVDVEDTYGQNDTSSAPDVERNIFPVPAPPLYTPSPPRQPPVMLLPAQEVNERTALLPH